MNTRFYLLLFLAGVLLFSGCIHEEFYQKVEEDGSSTITNTIDYTQFLTILNQQGELWGMPNGMSESEFEQSLQNSCSEAMSSNPDLECTAEGSTVIISLPFEADNPYYNFEMEDGIPYRTYRLIVNKIPIDVFNLQSTQSDGGLFGNQQPAQEVKPLDLTNVETASETMEQLKISGITADYVVEMPAEITLASSGSYEATINEETKNIARFDMMEVLEDPAPLVIEAQELNLTSMIAIIAVALLLLLALAFFTFKKR